MDLQIADICFIGACHENAALPGRPGGKETDAATPQLSANARRFGPAARPQEQSDESPGRLTFSLSTIPPYGTERFRAMPISFVRQQDGTVYELRCRRG